MKKEKYFIDLSKCSEDERKEIARIINQNGYSITSKANYEMRNGYYDELFPLLTFREYWYCSRYASGKTEITYPEFIKLFEDEDGENNGWIKIESEADLPKEAGDYWVFTVDESIKTIYVNGDISVIPYASHYWIRHFTHYQPIKKPLPPLNSK